jgi:hypothetical protein
MRFFQWHPLVQRFAILTGELALLALVVILVRL